MRVNFHLYRLQGHIYKIRTERLSTFATYLLTIFHIEFVRKLYTKYTRLIPTAHHHLLSANSNNNNNNNNNSIHALLRLQYKR
jgi:hypothetical protein